MSVNKVFLLGNLGKDPDVRYTSNQVAFCNFSIATTERRKDASGNWSDHTEWHNIVVFGNTATNCGKYLKKGRQVFIEGRLQTRKWQDKEGKDRYTTEVLGDRVQFIGSKQQDSSSGYESQVESFSSPNTFDAIAASSGIKSADDLDSNSVSFDDDDIPF